MIDPLKHWKNQMKTSHFDNINSWKFNIIFLNFLSILKDDDLSEQNLVLLRIQNHLNLRKQTVG